MKPERYRFESYNSYLAMIREYGDRHQQSLTFMEFDDEGVSKVVYYIYLRRET